MDRMQVPQPHRRYRRSIIALHGFAAFYCVDVLYSAWFHHEMSWRSLALGIAMLVAGQVMRGRLPARRR